jgi:phosphoribosylanthranilate isomerase
VGLVAEMPTGPGPISEDLIAHIADTVPPAVATFLLTSLTDPEAIIAQQRRCRTNTVQLCRSVAEEHLAAVRQALPGVSLVQVIHVTGPEAVVRARALGTSVDAILLDSGDPQSGVLGGTGQTHDWSLSRQIRDSVPVPVFLAGGLDAGNVARAIDTVRPYAVDLCSGVRVDGLLDEAKLTAFMAAVRTA